jgi:hypothetical protein
VFTIQLTFEFGELCTVALNWTVVPTKGCADAGVTVTVMGEEGLETRPPHEASMAAGNNQRKYHPRIVHCARLSRRGIDSRPE